MKSAKILFLSFYLLGLGFIVVPQNALAQDYSRQCCVCKGALNQQVDSCTGFLTQEQCVAKSTYAPNEIGALAGTSCLLESCSSYPLKCPAIQSQSVKKDAKLDPLKFIPNVKLPGFDRTDVDNNLLGDYIKALYKFFVGVAGILAVIMIAIGGLLWLFSSGDSGKITKAKEIIIGAIVGLMLVLGSYLILNTINPALVSFKPLDVSPIGRANIGDFCEPDIIVIGDNGKETIGQNLRCGERATVKGRGQTCIGRGCPGEADGEVCYFNPGMQAAACLKCADADNDILNKYNIPKTDAGCAQLTPQTNAPVLSQCLYGTVGFNGCRLIQVDCNEIKGCSDYRTKSLMNGARFVTILGGNRTLAVDGRFLDIVCTKDKNGADSRSGFCAAFNANASENKTWLKDDEQCVFDTKNLNECKTVNYSGEVEPCPSEANVLNIPTQNGRLIISPNTSDPRLFPDTIGKLAQAVVRLQQAMPNARLVVTGAYRSGAKQLELFNCYQTKLQTGQCPEGCGRCNLAARPSCDAPHQTGKAIDICIQNGPNGSDNCNHVEEACNNGACLPEGEARNKLIADQLYLQTFMKAQGFSRLCKEWWHFEYPAVSPGCEPGVYR